MTAEQVLSWIESYERAWRTPGTTALAELFTPDATYRQSPYAEPVTGLPAIEQMWEAERHGPDEVFRMKYELVAADRDVAVLRVEVWYGEPVQQEFRDLWIARFATDGRCQAFEEWPVAPEHPYTGDLA
ncbi:MAG: nuclear transport factor 2 family protein [Actinomycetota bacterium]